MNMLKAAARTINEDAMGASDIDYTDRNARIASAASSLVDYVYEYLLDDGVSYDTKIDLRVFGLIESMVARAMVAQYEYDQECCNDLICAITDNITPTPSA